MSTIPIDEERTGASLGRAQDDHHERRMHVVRRLMEQGMPVRALEALLPGWEEAIADAVSADHDRQRSRRPA